MHKRFADFEQFADRAGGLIALLEVDVASTPFCFLDRWILPGLWLVRMPSQAQNPRSVTSIVVLVPSMSLDAPPWRAWAKNTMPTEALVNIVRLNRKDSETDILIVIKSMYFCGIGNDSPLGTYSLTLGST